MSELSNLIIRLQRGVVRNSSVIKSIRHPQLLITSLQELNDLIGNDKVKDSVATQVSHLIMVKRRSLEHNQIKEDDVMLNTVLLGRAGVGKTLIGTKLAKIWYSLGFLDNSNNIKEKKAELSDMLKDLFKDGSGSTADDNTVALYVFFLFIIIFITLISLSWSFYSRFGGMWTLIVVGLFLVIILIMGYYISVSLNSSNNTNNTNNNINTNSKNLDARNVKDCNGKDKDCPINNTNSSTDAPLGVRNKNENNEYGNSPVVGNFPPDDQIIKIVTRVDFVDKYVGWTSPKTNKLLQENLGKVLFVDEAYSLLNGPHDEFGMEALTALNLFLSQHSKEIIVIFAGYKDLLETGPFSVQPGLKRRFMWQFDCQGYTPEQLFRIFKMQLNKKGWGLTDEAETLQIFLNNHDAFPSFGGDTERAGFFSELEHSRDYIRNENGMAINMLTPKHVQLGILKLRENTFSSDDSESQNPLANIMKMMSKPKNSAQPPINKNTPLYTDSGEIDDMELIRNIRDRSMERSHH